MPPAKLLIDYSTLNDPNAVDLLIFTSFIEKTPGVNGAPFLQRFANKPKVIMIHSKDKEGKKLKMFMPSKQGGNQNTGLMM